MRPVFHPVLVNGQGGDPALYVELLFEGRALLFDLGDLHGLAPRKVLRITHIFVPHAHMDHFVGFDHLLRICLGREKALHLFGPVGFVAQVEHKLAAYTWNLVQNYDNDFTVHATELDADGRGRRARFRCRSAFRREADVDCLFPTGLLLDEPLLQVRYAVLDHQTPSLAFSLTERQHVNVWKSRLEARGLPVGPWLRELKTAVLSGAADNTPISIPGGDGIATRNLPLGELREQVLRLVPGQKLTYVADHAFTAQNCARVTALAAGADLLFIEAAFLAEDAQRAAATFHSTAQQAGWLGHAAGAARLLPFHFSPRYTGAFARLEAEAQRAFRAGPPAGGLMTD